MREQLMKKLLQCNTAYQIRDVWEEVTSCLKSGEIDMDDFTAIQSAKYTRLKDIDVSHMHHM